MKVKNLPDGNSYKSLEQLTQEANDIIKELEGREDLKDSIEEYQKLIKLNNIIQKKFQNEIKAIKRKSEEKIKKIVKKKNDK